MFDLIWHKSDVSRMETIITAVVFVSVTCFLSIIFPNIAQVLSIMGGLLASTMNYLIPMIIQLKLSKQSFWNYQNIGAFLFFSSLVLIGYTSAVLTVYAVSQGWTIMPRHGE